MNSDPGAQAQRKRAALQRKIRTGSRWRHTRTGHVYTVVGVVVEEETLALAVVYADMVSGWQWSRPALAWDVIVTLEDGSKSPRFVEETS